MITGPQITTVGMPISEGGEVGGASVSPNVVNDDKQATAKQPSTDDYLRMIVNEMSMEELALMRTLIDEKLEGGSLDLDVDNFEDKE